MAIFISISLLIGIILVCIFVPFLVGKLYLGIEDKLLCLTREDYEFSDCWIAGMTIIAITCGVIGIAWLIITWGILPLVNSWGIK